MLKAISAIFAVAAIAGAVTLFQGTDVKASALAALSAKTSAMTSAVTPAKTDRADLQQDCAQHSWPYYQAACLRDDTRNAGRVLKVRVVSTDRVAQANPNTNPDLAPHWPVMLTELQIATPAWARGTK
jgi:hypothetical protein